MRMRPGKPPPTPPLAHQTMKGHWFFSAHSADLLVLLTDAFQSTTVQKGEVLLKRGVSARKLASAWPLTRAPSQARALATCLWWTAGAWRWRRWREAQCAR